MAAPAVSGAAMLLASLGTFSPDQLEAALKTAVTPFPTSIQGGWRQCLVGVCGSGALSLDQVPAPVSAPTFSGRAAAGSTVTAVAAGWTGPATPMAYTWLVNGVAVSSGPSYHLPASALGSTLALRAAPASGAFTPIYRDSSPVKIAKAFSKIKLTGPRRVARFGRPEVRIKVKAGLNPTGKLKVFDGKKKIGTAVASTIGYESNEDLDNGMRPPGLIRMSTTTGAVPQYLQDFGNTTAPGHHDPPHHDVPRLQRRPGVQRRHHPVDAGGSTTTHDRGGAAADPRMQQAQVNLFADMGVQPDHAGHGPGGGHEVDRHDRTDRDDHHARRPAPRSPTAPR